MFGTELTVMKNAVEIIKELRYKLYMFGVPINGSTNIFCDNEMLYVKNTRPESTLSNKHNIISYHRARYLVAEVTVRFSKEHTLTDLADLFTKTMAELKREVLLENLHIERRIVVYSFSTLVRVYQKQSTQLYWKEPN